MAERPRISVATSRVRLRPTMPESSNDYWTGSNSEFRMQNADSDDA